MPAAPATKDSVQKWELPLIAGLTLFTCLRIFFGAAALPLFTNVDEPSHYDLVCKYARGYLPQPGNQAYDAESAHAIVLYASPEYLYPETPGVGGSPPPVWSYPPDKREIVMQRNVEKTAKVVNHEALSPPVYYSMAGLWYKLGLLLGLEGGLAIHWIRFLNVLLYPPVVAIAYFFVRRFYPDQLFLRLSVPVLAAFIPQDVFYSINSDVPSPLFFLIALYLLLVWRERDVPSWGTGIAAGLMTALTFLIKFSNIAIIVLFAAAWVHKVVRIARQGALLRRLPEVLATGAAGALPVAGWLWRNYVVLGDLTASREKVEQLTWTYKPFSRVFVHPFFTPAGFGFFWGETLSRFWRGETVWHHKVITPVVADYFFIGISAIFVTMAVVRWWLDRRKTPRENLGPDGYLLASVFISFLFLVYLSLVFDFGTCVYPSRKMPYMVSGRLIIGTLLPFLIILTRGFEFTISKLVPDIALAPRVVFAAILLMSTICWLTLLMATMPSQYNWFHL